MSPRVTRLLVVGGASLALLAALAGPASAGPGMPPPPEGRTCPKGYTQIVNYTSWAGAATDDGGILREYWEIVGVGCFKRTSKTQAKVRFTWGSSRLYEAAFTYQLLDCSTGRVPRSLDRHLNYPRGTRSGGGKAAATFLLNSKHKYRLRILGTGVYDRRPFVHGGDGLHGYFRGPNGPRGVKPWFSQTSCK
ncbi:hypothetical protein [Actinomadura rupiterrae]|uniref:hypothetical protein n=1 Tax=Actinomadura rupiterrae TaxID=559627 RepID=UPI0020A47719|nr:hypothetical protein [Actinomadura rupiterrae]MCP2335205.1 hypothetical protein [Actinomadura rupiterrae]